MNKERKLASGTVEDQKVAQVIMSLQLALWLSAPKKADTLATEIPASQAQLASRSAKVARRSAMLEEVTDELSRLKLLSAADSTISSDSISNEETCKRPARRASVTCRREDIFAKMSICLSG